MWIQGPGSVLQVKKLTLPQGYSFSLLKAIPQFFKPIQAQ